MHLGQIISQLSDETIAAEAMISLNDLGLMAEAGRLATHFEESLGEYASGAVARFARLASDDDWLALTTALENSNDPGVTCLQRMVSWSIREDDKALAGPEHAHAGGSCGCHT